VVVGCGWGGGLWGVVGGGWGVGGCCGCGWGGEGVADKEERVGAQGGGGGPEGGGWGRWRSAAGTALGTALGRHFRGEGAPSWLVLVCGDWIGVVKSVGTHWGR